MLAVLYLILCFVTGSILCSLFFPGLRTITDQTFDKRSIKVSKACVLIPAWFVSGTLLITWTVYLTAYILRNTSNPLGTANMIILPLFGLLFACYYFFKSSDEPGQDEMITKKPSVIRDFFKNATPLGIALFVFASVLSIILMYMSLHQSGNKLYIGLTVFSDFSPHIGMIRSFSQRSNFPTVYQICAGDDIKYHFMFQFLVGNLEFLGMRLDLAFNIPSIISLVCVFMLVYFLTVKITGKNLAGFLSGILIAFRSSLSFWLYLLDKPADMGVFEYLHSNTEFIGSTPNENWGLWNLNVYCNQRHLAFSMVVMLILIIAYIPRVYEMCSAVSKAEYGMKLRTLFFQKEGWLTVDFREPVFLGIMLGAIGFWNGAVLIFTVIVLFFMAAVSEKRLEYVITAAIAGVLSLLQTNSFISGSALSFSIRTGFISEDHSLLGINDYIIKLLGGVIILLIIAFVIGRGYEQYLLFAFCMPIVFAFTVSMTPDVAVNHKYIFLSMILLDCFAASVLSVVLSKANAAGRLLVIVLIAAMLATGIYDFDILCRKNIEKNNIVLYSNNPIPKWIWDNTEPDSLFLTGNYYISGGTGSYVILSGARLYQGWEYFGWSAGYDTGLKDAVVAQAYSADTPEELRSIVDENGFDYITVDYTNRYAEEYVLNEENIKATYPEVFSFDEGDWKFSIYKTH